MARIPFLCIPRVFQLTGLEPEKLYYVTISSRPAEDDAEEFPPHKLAKRPQKLLHFWTASGRVPPDRFCNTPEVSLHADACAELAQSSVKIFAACGRTVRAGRTPTAPPLRRALGIIPTANKIVNSLSLCSLFFARSTPLHCAIRPVSTLFFPPSRTHPCSPCVGGFPRRYG